MDKDNTPEKPKPEYKNTLNLPRTDFPMKAGLPQKEPLILKKWEKDGLYSKIIAARKNSKKTFILHDGPPYANGHIHMGHVLNKILKDICVKYYTMNGHYAPYVPGWDCHGLPVEHQLFKELNMTKEQICQVDFRKKAYKYAMKFVRIQADEFKRLGILGEWDDPYLTLTKDYESNILSALAELYEKGYIYKGLKPVNWCRSCETALAEAEVEYEDKTSPSIYVKFRLSGPIDGKKAFLVIWTTTPWTLLANVAVALHPDLDYAFVAKDGEILIMLAEAVPRLMEKFGVKEYKVSTAMRGSDLVAKYPAAVHPFIDRTSKLVLADYVTSEDGTGCVHTAPGHGQDDYKTGKKYGLDMLMPVNDKGVFTKDGGEFAGVEVFEANPLIIKRLESLGAVLKTEDVTHSYPHCWRCKKPIIFRATEQWFLNIEHAGLRDRMMRMIREDVKWIPEIGIERIGSMIGSRPDWCLSRQRYWGVPIPAFHCADCGESYTSAELIKKVADETRRHGADVWFEKKAEDLLPAGHKCAVCSSVNFKKEENILDVWFDSGVSHRAVLEERENLSFPADLYLEGSDQHRGWFQAALITSAATRGVAPYRNVLTHGFVVDGEGKKMSKSMGNVIGPEEIMRDYGADILRLWVSSSDYDGDIKLSPEILARLSDGYRKIRNTFKYLLSNLYDFDPAKDAVLREKMPEIDRWMLSRLYSLTKDVDSHYKSWEFYKVYRAVYDFCVYEVSSFYLDVSKDILYILGANSPERRAAQTVMFRILDTLVRLLAPVLSFTTEEVWTHMNFSGKLESVHMADWPETGSREPSGWEDKALDDKVAKLLSIRDVVMKVLEIKRESGLIGSSLEARLTLCASDESMGVFLKENKGLMSVVFRVSQIELADKELPGMEAAAGYPFSMGVERAHGEKCPRCWNYSQTVGADKERPELCARCASCMSERR
jgi:isoleucyl-tRNA synthetase